MKIGIIGSGGVAQTLGSGYLAKGYEVKLGTRDASKLSDWLAAAGDKASAGSFSDAARFGDVVFLTVNSAAIDSAIDLAGKSNLTGKTVVDLTNPMDFSQGLPPRFAAAFGNSLGERVQRALPESHVVKAFNSVGVEMMTDARFGDQLATMLIAGNDDVAKSQVTALVAEFGWDVVDLGGIDQAFYLEAMSLIWVNYSIKSGSRAHAFKLLKR